MTQHRHPLWLGLGAGLIFSLLLSGCARPTAAPDSAGILEIRQLAVMPFITVAGSSRYAAELDKTLDCELSGLCTFDDPQLSETEQILTRQLTAALAEHYADQLLPQREITNHFLDMTKPASETPRQLAARLGSEVGADHVMVGLLWRFQQRTGGALSAERPASVIFSLFLVDVAEKKLVREGGFEKTQHALSENLFDASLFFGHGIKWLTAEELAEYGMTKAVEEMVFQ